MRRREFITFLGSTAVWPLAARAQQPERIRRIGVLTSVPADDPDGRVRIAAFMQGLQQLGWTVGRNVQIEYRWAAGSADDLRKYARELVALAPEVIFAAGGTSLGSLLQATRARADRVRDRSRSSRFWLRRQLAAAGWQHHRLYAVRI
jgi:putative ABC transport system substrate-binding protein